MTAVRKLRAVEPDPPVDITLLLRAEIKARDWERCHIEGDRRRPIELVDRVWRGWIR